MRVEQRSLRKQRWIARLPRLALVATAVVLSAAGARSIAEGDEQLPAPTRPVARVDIGAAGFAEVFARVYLSWDAERPEDRPRAIASMSAEALDAGVELRPPNDRSRSVTVASAINEERRGDRVIVTVAATVESRILHLAVPVARNPKGLLFVPAPPAIVGPPVALRGERVPEEELVEDPDLVEVATRAVRNYVSRERTNLIADLADDAVIALPDHPLQVERVESVTWCQRQRRVAVVLDARDREGAAMTLRYELEVVRNADRWLVRSIGTNPSAREAMQ